MFALEITFQDGVSQPETIFIRRPQALIGAADTSHIVIEDMKELDFQLHLSRDLGRKFKCKPIGARGDLQVPGVLEGVYDGQAFFDLGPVKFQVTALDSDLPIKETEPPDRAGVRIMRLACASGSPLFPAVMVQGTNPVTVSFVADQPIFIGRSKHCGLRLDSAEISSKHARMGYESGEFWIEDLGSTNGTFVNNVQISGRMNVAAGVQVTLGRDLAITGVTSEEQILRASRSSSEKARPAPVPERKYPVLISVSEVARPARLVIPIGATLNIGRDPGSDVWLGAPHVSRKHCVVALSKTGNVQIVDFSTNGTNYDNKVLKKGDVLEVSDTPKVLDFGGGVTLALCFNEEEENLFIGSNGSPNVFFKSAPAQAENILSGSYQRKVESPVVSTPGIDVEKFDAPARSGVLDRLKGLFKPMSKRQKFMFIVAAFFTLAVLVIVASLAIPVFV
jgi:pSer/pThr/pTyr-binding forkhead associated (FHA) protein